MPRSKNKKVSQSGVGYVNIATFMLIHFTCIFTTFAFDLEPIVLSGETLTDVEKYWSISSPVKSYEKPSMYKENLTYLDDDNVLEKNVWILDSENELEFQLSSDNILTDYCEVENAEIVMKYHADLATGYFEPCEPTNYCYLKPSTKEWTETKIKINDAKALDSPVRIEGIVMPGGYIMFNEITISFDGTEKAKCTTTTAPTTTTSEPTTETTTDASTPETEATDPSDWYTQTTIMTTATTPTTVTTTISTTTTEEDSGTQETEETETATDDPTTPLTTQPTTEPTTVSTTQPTTEPTTISTTQSTTEPSTTLSTSETSPTTVPTSETSPTTLPTSEPTSSPPTTTPSTSSNGQSTTPVAAPSSDKDGMTLKEILLYIALPASVAAIAFLSLIFYFGFKGYCFGGGSGAKHTGLEGQTTSTNNATGSSSKMTPTGPQNPMASASYFAPATAVPMHAPAAGPGFALGTPYNSATFFANPAPYQSSIAVPAATASAVPRGAVAIGMPVAPRTSGRYMYTGEYLNDPEKNLPRMRRKLD